MNHTTIAHMRLYNQYIAYHLHETPRQVVEALGALQAQDYPGALWSVALRTKAATARDVEKAIAQKEIIRTWPMRGTLHLVSAQDSRWMTNLMSPRIMARAVATERALGLTEKDFAKSFAVIEKALGSGEPMQRTHLFQKLADAGIATSGQRGYHTLWRAAQLNLICLGPMDGKQPTFVWLDAWLPKSKDLSREASLATIVHRYLMSHSPATVHDMMWWTGLTKRDILAGLAEVQAHFISEDIDGVTYWMRPDQPSIPYDHTQTALLPGFDEYLLGYRDRSAALDRAHAAKVLPGNNGVFMPTIVCNGQIIGLWKRVMRTRAISITLYPFTKLQAKQLSQIEQAAQRYGVFHGLPITIMVADSK